MKKVLIVGSSHKDGETGKLANALINHSDWDIIYLNDYTIHHYDYEHQHREDDFIPLMKKIIDNYSTFIFATPVYWYAMSGIMKVFFDRLTDLLEIEKDLGRKLRTKKMAAVSTSIGNNLGDVFWLPFSETAQYLGMKYIGNMHVIQGKIEEVKIQSFVQLIEDSEKQQVI